MVSRSSLLLALMVAALIAAAIPFTLSRMQGPAPAGLTAAPTDFSSARAMAHLQRIAAAPRPLGSRGHDQARDYISAQLAALGAEHEVQRATVAIDDPRDTPAVAHVENVIGRLHGTRSEGAIVLLAHYDSVPTGPGASDDGHAVAVLLETARALQARGALRNDVILLFSDGEEMGTLGSRAFVEQHRWFKDVKVALNFEARGTSGPTVLFETGPKSGWTVEHFGHAARLPIGNSLLPRLYARLPNKTDLTVVSKSGVMGLNFAFFGGFAGYHSQNDSIAALDPRSLQHQGDHALETTWSLGNASLSTPPRADSVFFDLLGARFVSYREALVPPFTLLCAALFVVVLLAGVRTGRIAWRGLAAAAGGYALALVVVPAASELLARAVTMIHPDYRSIPAGEPHVATLFRLAFLVVGLALAVLLHSAIARRANRAELTMGAAAVWLIALLVTTVLLPESTYLLTWPLLLLLLPLAVSWWRRGESHDGWQLAMLLPALVLAIVLLVPWIDWTFIILTIRGAAAALLFAMLLFGVAVAAFGPGGWQWRRKVAIVMLFGGVILFAAALSNPAGTKEDPLMTSLEYAQDADNGSASWIAQSEPTDDWRASFFKSATDQDGFTDFVPYLGWKVWRTPAPVISFAAPELSTLSDTTVAGLRTLTLRIRQSADGGQHRDVALMSIFLPDQPELIGASIDGHPLSPKSLPKTRWGIRYLAPPAEGFELQLVTRAAGPLQVRAVAKSYGLAGLPVPPRTADVIPSSFGFGTLDAVYVGKTFRF